MFATRNRKGEHALLMNLLNNTPDASKIREGAMQLFATTKAHDKVIEPGIRVHPASETMLRKLQEPFDMGTP